MAHPSPAVVYEHLEHLDLTDTLSSAEYRQDAVEVLADLEVSMDWRQAIADRLEDVNRTLTFQNVGSEDSY